MNYSDYEDHGYEYGDIEWNDDDNEMTWEQREQYAQSFEPYDERDYNQMIYESDHGYEDESDDDMDVQRVDTQNLIDALPQPSQESANAAAFIEREAFLVHHRAVIQHLSDAMVHVIYVDGNIVKDDDIHQYTRYLPTTGCRDYMRVSTAQPVFA